MPFGSYLSVDSALQNAVRLLQEGNMEAIKVEGGKEIAPLVRKITSYGIPVMGHVGLQAQRIHSLGGFKVQGKTPDAAVAILEDSLALQDAGCFSIVLECIPEYLASLITKRLHIPTIGIGAGRGCSGQVLVQLDMLGMYERFCPKWVVIFMYSIWIIPYFQ